MTVERTRGREEKEEMKELAFRDEVTLNDDDEGCSGIEIKQGAEVY